MIAILRVVLDLYFAAVLGVSGIAKVKDPELFAYHLQRQGLLPQWSAATLSRIIPLGEIALAGALVSGLAPLIVAELTLAVFAGFLGTKVLLLVTGRAADCGCFGFASKQTVDAAGVLTSMALVCLAIVHVSVVNAGVRVDWLWRVPTALVLGGAGVWLVWKARPQHLFAVRRA